MFSTSNKSVKSESEVLIDFLANSKELKKMRYLSLTSPASVHYESINSEPTRKVETYPQKEMVAKISSARTFSEILVATERMNTNSAALNTVLYVAGFFNADANFVYYLSQFRQKAIEIMADKGFSAEPTQTHLY